MMGLLQPAAIAKIMWGRCFGPKAWQHFFGRALEAGQLDPVPAFPWGCDVLLGSCPYYANRQVCDTHFAFLGLDRLAGHPLTILAWHRLRLPGTLPFSGEPDYGRERFAVAETCERRWYLALLELVPGSLHDSESRRGLTYQEQCRHLRPGYQAPSAVVEVTKRLLYYGLQGQGINPYLYARTRSLWWRRRGLVDVGDHGGSLHIGGYPSRERLPVVGLAAERYPPPAG